MYKKYTWNFLAFNGRRVTRIRYITIKEAMSIENPILREKHKIAVKSLHLAFAAFFLTIPLILGLMYKL